MVIVGVSGFGSFCTDVEKGRKAESYKETVVMEMESCGKDGEEIEKITRSKKTVEKERAAEKEETAEMAPVSQEDFKELAKINPDIVGWIRIPGTNIDYPIVQGYDNEVYLHKDFEGKSAAAGSIFLDFESQSNLRGYHNILYGHHMKDGSMFRDLVFFQEESYFKEHQYFQIYTPKETIYLKAIACYYISNDPFVRRTRFRREEDFQQFVQEMAEPCEYAEFPSTPVRGLYTLITCSYETEDGRTVLFAVEAEEKI